MMRMQPNESYEEWADRVQKFEIAYAKNQLANGAEVDLVIANLSTRIQQKMLYPVFVALRHSTPMPDVEQSKKSYEENYLKRNNPKADHVDSSS